MQAKEIAAGCADARIIRANHLESELVSVRPGRGNQAQRFPHQVVVVGVLDDARRGNRLVQELPSFFGVHDTILAGPAESIPRIGKRLPLPAFEKHRKQDVGKTVGCGVDDHLLMALSQASVVKGSRTIAGIGAIP